MGNVAPSGFAYDASGDVTSDNTNTYLYDADGRICAVRSEPVPGTWTMTGYLYDADGTRVAKGSLTTWPSSCGAPGSNGFALENQYLLDLGGDQVTELNGTGGWVHSNVWAGAHLDATYASGGLYFHLADPLGSRRIATGATGTVVGTYQSWGPRRQVFVRGVESLPFGDGEICRHTLDIPRHRCT